MGCVGVNSITLNSCKSTAAVRSSYHYSDIINKLLGVLYWFFVWNWKLVVLQFLRQILHLEDEELQDIPFHQTLFVLMFSCNSQKLILDDPLQPIPVILWKTRMKNNCLMHNNLEVICYLHHQLIIWIFLNLWSMQGI